MNRTSGREPTTDLGTLLAATLILLRGVADRDATTPLAGGQATSGGSRSPRATRAAVRS